MNIKYLAAAAVTLAPVFAVAASASNVLTFRGEVATQTCEIAINGNKTAPTVLLPTVAASALTAANSTAGLTPFTISVTGCPVSATAVQPLKVVFVGNGVDSQGNLRNAGTATQVALQLLDPAVPGTPFNLSTAGGYAATGLSLAANAATASHDFGVRYISTAGGATAGSVVGSVQYAVSYR